MLDTRFFSPCLCRSLRERDADLVVQLDVFDEENARDAEELPGPAGVDLNSHLDVFHAVLKQVMCAQRTTWSTM